MIGENRNFGGNEELLRQHGVTAVIADDARCIDLMARLIRDKPWLWNEDIGLS